MTATGRDAIKVDHDDLGVTTISINRPDRMNAFTGEMMLEMGFTDVANAGGFEDLAAAGLPTA